MCVRVCVCYMSTIINIDNVLESVVIFPAAWMTVPSTCTIRSFILTSAHAMHFTSQGTEVHSLCHVVPIHPSSRANDDDVDDDGYSYLYIASDAFSVWFEWLVGSVCSRSLLFVLRVRYHYRTGGWWQQQWQNNSKKKHIFHQCKRVEKNMHVNENKGAKNKIK